MFPNYSTVHPAPCTLLYRPFVVFVLTYLRMAQVQAETCSGYVRANSQIKTNLCCVRLNNCGLFSTVDTTY